MARLTGKVAIVTGASKGIGAGIAKSLAEEGASVVVNYASSGEGAKRVVDEIKARGGRAVAIKADVTKDSGVKKLFEDSKREFGVLDVLVNNAGVYKFEALELVREDEFHRQFGTNVLAPILTAQRALEYFGAKGGSIINIGSVASSNPRAGAVIYSATKGALDVVTMTLAKELGARKIRVNSVNPGNVTTEGILSLGIDHLEMEKAAIAMTPLGRIGLPEDIGKVVAFLASEDGAWVTGQLISVSGGMP